MIKKVDLHIHTCCSDGALTPKEIIDEANKRNISIISITDHDTVDAYTDELYEYAKKENIKLINGIEISTRYNKLPIHVLGYNIDINNKVLTDRLNKARNNRHIYLHEVTKKLEELGYIVNIKELDKIEAVTKAHIARDIISNVKNEEILNEFFGHIPNMGEFIEGIMNEGCPAFVKKETMTPKEAADLIRITGGKAVLAHPVAYIYERNILPKDIETIVSDMQPDGIEANYIYIDKLGKIINEIEFWNQFAKKHNLPVTTGSDFHKFEKGRDELGDINDYVKMEDKKLKDILDFLDI